MAFSQTETMRFKGVNGTICMGTYTNTSASVGGDLTHGLAMVTSVVLTNSVSTTGYSEYVNESLPASGAVSIVTTTGVTGCYMIAGY